MLGGASVVILPALADLIWVRSAWSGTFEELLRGWSLLKSNYSNESSPSQLSVAQRSSEDSVAVAAVLAGDREAFAILVRRYETRVRGYCARMLQGSADGGADAEDAAQEVFVRAFRSLHRFRGEASFSSWLYRIAANHCIDLARRERIRGWFRFGKEIGDTSEAVEVSSNMHGSLSAENAAESAPSLATRQILVRVLAALPPAQRSLIILREAHGLSYEELAQTLQLSEDSVKAHLRRARKRLLEIRAEIENKIEREQNHG